MMLTLLDSFDDATGRLLNYQTTSDRSTAQLGYVGTNQHVNLRSFYNVDIKRHRTQAELDGLTQTTLENTPYDIQSGVEYEYDLIGENWQYSAGALTGGFTAATMAVGMTGGSYYNWRLLSIVATGVDAVNATFTSIIPVTSVPASAAINISTMDSLSMIIAGTGLSRSDMVAANSWVQLTSDPAGSFASSASPQVPFTSNTSAIGTELRLPMSSFTGCDLTKITGIRIHVDRTAIAGTMYIGAIRAVKSTWTYRNLDVETRRKVLAPSIPLDFSTTTFSATPSVPLIRGAQTPDGPADPIGVDGKLVAYFQAGGSTASGTTFGSNIIDLIFREHTTHTNSGAADGAGSYITCRLFWSQFSTTFSSFRTDVVGGTGTTAPGTPASVDLGFTLSRVTESLDHWDDSMYAFVVNVVGTRIEAQLYSSDSVGSLKSLLWSKSISNPYAKASVGRYGIYAQLADGASFVHKFDALDTGFATLRTKQFASYTPIDGAQLTAACASDMNLFSEFRWNVPDDEYIDPTKTTSGNGSYRTANGVLSNLFHIDDWQQCYLRLDMFAPASITAANQPQLSLISTVADESGAVVKIQLPKLALVPNQWNTIEFDLGAFANAYSGQPYWLDVACPDPASLGYVWIDSVMVGQRRIRWQLRATTNGTWRDVRTALNAARGAVHLPIAERGKLTQLQAIALTTDAWVSSYILRPHYAELGAPLHDESFKTS